MSKDYNDLYANALRVVRERDTDIAFLKQAVGELERERDALLADNARMRGVRPDATTGMVRDWFYQYVDASKERDALLADNARMREAIVSVLQQCDCDINPGRLDCRDALAATPEQSLARLRNQVREECAELCFWIEDAEAIRTMKEPE